MKKCCSCQNKLPSSAFYKNQANCKKCAKEKLSAWRKTNPEKLAAIQRRYRATESGKKSKAKSNRRQNGTDLQKAREKIVKYRRRYVTIGEYKAPRTVRGRELVAILRALPDYCVRCNTKEDLTVDHIIPLSKGGAPFDKENLTTLCGPCNTSKGNRW